MKKIVFALAVFSLSISGKLYSQVSLSPELGISYWPFSIETGSSLRLNQSKRLNYIIGISGSVPVHDKWSVIMRLSYSNREDMKWLEGNIFPTEGELIHADINIDISMGFNVHKHISLWIGPSVVRKLKSSVQFHYYYPDQDGPYTISRSIDRFFYGFSMATSIDIKKFIIRAEYARFFWDQDDPDWGYFRGGHRYNLVLSYPVFTSKKR